MTNEKGKEKSGGRPPMRQEELQLVGLRFLEKITALGPRKGESKLAFGVRLAGLREGRRLILEAILKAGGCNGTMTYLLGIHQSNMRTTLTRFGIGGVEMERREALVRHLNELNAQAAPIQQDLNDLNIGQQEEGDDQ